MMYIFDGEESIVGKLENAYQHFLSIFSFLPQCFQKYFLENATNQYFLLFPLCFLIVIHNSHHTRHMEFVV